MKTLIIDRHGSFLGMKDGMFRVTSKEGEVQVSPSEVDEILVSSSGAISTAVIRESVDRGITLAFLDSRGNVWGILLPSVVSETVRTKRAQYEAVLQGKDYGREFLRRKIRNQEAHLRSWRRRGARVEATLPEDEASAARVYWGEISRIYPQFKGRDHESRDPLNVSLNYAYAILYYRVLKYLVLAGLDPYLGFVHRDRSGKESLVYDFSEMFKPYVDMVVLNALKEGLTVTLREGLMDGESRDRLAKAVVQGMEERVKEREDHNPKTLNQAMRSHALRFASALREGRDYRGFMMSL